MGNHTVKKSMVYLSLPVIVKAIYQENIKVITNPIKVLIILKKPLAGTRIKINET